MPVTHRTLCDCHVAVRFVGAMPPKKKCALDGCDEWGEEVEGARRNVYYIVAVRALSLCSILKQSFLRFF